MQYGTKYNVLKYVHTFFCCWIVVWSCAMIGTAIFLRHHLFPFNDFLYYYGTVITSCLIYGIPVSITIAIWGCIAVHKTLQHLVAFAITLSCALGAHIVVAVVYMFYISSLFKETIETLFSDGMKNYEQYSDSVDYVQLHFNCCGYKEPEDWANILEYFPLSCCPESGGMGGCLVNDLFHLLSRQGCIKYLQHLPRLGMEIISVLFLILQIFQITTLLLTCYLCWCLMKKCYTENVYSLKSKEVTKL